jgi:hypothetical protein
MGCHGLPSAPAVSHERAPLQHVGRAHAMQHPGTQAVEHPEADIGAILGRNRVNPEGRHLFTQVHKH